MTPNRLDKSMRSKIRYELLKHRFMPEIVSIYEQTSNLADRFYFDQFENDIRKMTRLPKGWLPTYDAINIIIHSGERDQFYFNGSHCFGSKHSPCIQFNRFNRYDHAIKKRPFLSQYTSKVYTVSSPLTIARTQLIDRKTDLNTSIQVASDYAQKILESVTTIPKLLELWPDIAPFIPKIEEVRVANLPAVPIDDLNKMFKLPPETAKKKKAA